MFDRGVSRLIEGVGIDRPDNALSLQSGYHRDFGAFRICFTPIPDKEHTYRIEAFKPFGFNSLPVTRQLFQLFLSPNIDPPSPRLLAIHRAIGHILHLSGAGEYIDKCLRDMEEGCVRADGSTPLDVYVRLCLSCRRGDISNVC